MAAARSSFFVNAVNERAAVYRCVGGGVARFCRTAGHRGGNHCELQKAYTRLSVAGALFMGVRAGGNCGQAVPVSAHRVFGHYVGHAHVVWLHQFNHV